MFVAISRFHQNFDIFGMNSVVALDVIQKCQIVKILFFFNYEQGLIIVFRNFSPLFKSRQTGTAFIFLVEKSLM